MVGTTSLRRWESGSGFVHSGKSPQSYLLAGAGPIAFCLINICTTMRDRPELYGIGRGWEVVTWQASSAIVTLLLMPLVAYAFTMGRAAFSVRKARVGAVHALAFLAFFLLHVGGFVLVRLGVYGLHGISYRFGGLDAWIYELPKDAVTYVILAATFAALSLRRLPSVPPSISRDLPAAAARTAVNIRDRGHIIVAPAEDIVAFCAAGNYVEVRLRDGRTPLMRGTLSSLVGELGANGFVRTHRSWIVNQSFVREVIATKSGDHLILLGDGSEVPLSRRYAPAITRLRQMGLNAAQIKSGATTASQTN